MPIIPSVLFIDQSLELKDNAIQQYDDFSSYVEDDGHSLGKVEEFKQIVASQTTFTTISKTGEVWTWGDARYEPCLGREVSDER